MLAARARSCKAYENRLAICIPVGGQLLEPRSEKIVQVGLETPLVAKMPGQRCVRLPKAVDDPAPDPIFRPRKLPRDMGAALTTARALLGRVGLILRVMG